MIDAKQLILPAYLSFFFNTIIAPPPIHIVHIYSSQIKVSCRVLGEREIVQSVVVRSQEKS